MVEKGGIYLPEDKHESLNKGPKKRNPSGHVEVSSLEKESKNTNGNGQRSKPTRTRLFRPRSRYPQNSLTFYTHVIDGRQRYAYDGGGDEDDDDAVDGSDEGD